MTNTEVRLDRHDGWAEIVIDRPDRRNSITAPVSEAMLNYLTEVETDNSVSAVMIRGEGGYFCSGVDLRALQADPPPPWRDRQNSSWRDLHLTLFRYSKPVVGAVEKFAINAGAGLAFACDLLIVGETAFIQVGEIRQGVGMPMNAAWLRIKSDERTLARLAFYGDRINGPELMSLGLINECVADDQVVNRARAVCAQMAEFPTGASTVVKQTLIESRRIEDVEAFFHFDVKTSLNNAALLKS